MDASHKEWFGGLFADFREAMRDGIFVGNQAIDAVRCVETIDAAYESASRRSLEVLVNPVRPDQLKEERRLRAVTLEPKAS